MADKRNESERLRDLGPYAIFADSVKQVGDFVGLAELAFGLTQQLLFKHPVENLPAVPRPARSAFAEASYCQADQEIEEVELEAGWLSLESYAERTGESLEHVRDQLERGELGAIERDPKTGEVLLLWPADYARGSNELPEPGGKNRYRVKSRLVTQLPFEIDVEDGDSFEQNQQLFLTLAHALGDPGTAAENASEMLWRSGILLHWTACEVFLRGAIHALIRRHPVKLSAGRHGRRKSLTYEELAEMSLEFTSMDALIDKLMQQQLEDEQSAGGGIHGLMNFLKREFSFEKDPYNAWYVLNGRREEVGFNGLLEIKEIRNALVHQEGKAPLEFSAKHPHVQLADGRIVVSKELYMKTVLSLRAVAHSVATSILEEKYRA